MLNEKGPEGQTTQKSLKKQPWSIEDFRIMLEFILLNPHLVGSAPCSTATTTALHNFISPRKTFQECQTKMINLKSTMKSNEKIVDYLKKKTQLSDEWILEKRKESGYFHISHFKKELMDLREPQTIEQRALRMFLSNFHHKEAVFHSAKSSLPNIFTSSSSDSLNNLLTNQLNIHDHPSKVIELKIINSAEKTEKTSNLSNQFQQPLFSIETIIKENIEDQQKSQIISQQKNDEMLDFKNQRFDHLQRLDYLLFILKYQKQFEHISQCSIIARLANFMRPRTERYCSKYHAQLMKKYMTVENIISEILNENLFIQENEFMREIVKIKNFFQKDLERQFNAFASKSKLILESSDEQILEITRIIKQQLAAKMDLRSSDQQSKHSMISQQLPSETKQSKFDVDHSIDSIQLPIELTIVFEKFQKQSEKEAKNPSSFEEKASNDEFIGKKIQFQPKSIRKNPRNHQEQNFALKSKKERLKEKKIEKFEKSEIRRPQNSKEDVFVESDEDFDQFNVFAGNHSESKSDQSSSENDQSRNQEDCENLESANVIKKPSIKKNKMKEDKMLNYIDLKAKMESEQKEFQVQQKEIHHQKPKINILWTLSQRMKVIAFMIVNKLALLEGNTFKKQGMTEKLSKYIGTQRSYIQCKGQFRWLKKIYKHDIDRLLNEQGKKFNINVGLLQKWKKISDFYSSNNSIQIEDYSLEVKVLPMTYVMASPKEIMRQLSNLIKNGPFLELKMRKANKEVQKFKETQKNVKENQTKLKSIKFKVKVYNQKFPSQILRSKLQWTLRITSSLQ